MHFRHGWHLLPDRHHLDSQLVVGWEVLLDTDAFALMVIVHVVMEQPSPVIDIITD